MPPTGRVARGPRGRPWSSRPSRLRPSRSHRSPSSRPSSTWRSWTVLAAAASEPEAHNLTALEVVLGRRSPRGLVRPPRRGRSRRGGRGRSLLQPTASSEPTISRPSRSPSSLWSLPSSRPSRSWAFLTWRSLVVMALAATGVELDALEFAALEVVLVVEALTAATVELPAPEVAAIIDVAGLGRRGPRCSSCRSRSPRGCSHRHRRDRSPRGRGHP